MRVEVLYLEGCPNHSEAVEMVRVALRAAGHSEQIHQVEIRTQAEAEALAFLGSPACASMAWISSQKPAAKEHTG